MSVEGYPWWVLIGLAGNAFFFSRFIVQWAVSESKKESVIPVSFWYLSIVGSLLLLAYGIADRDPVIIIGNTPNAIVYFRNLMLIRMRAAERRRDEELVSQPNILPVRASLPPQRKAG